MGIGSQSSNIYLHYIVDGCFFNLCCFVFFAALAALSLPSQLTDSHGLLSRGIGTAMRGHITSNFLSQAGWRLYEIRQPPNCLCTTSNFHRNTIIETFKHCLVGHLGRYLATICGANCQRQVNRTEKRDRTDRTSANMVV